MLHADLVEGTHDGTLEQAPHAFDAVRVDIAHDPFVEVVLHGVMLDAHTVPEATVGRKLVGVDGEGFIWFALIPFLDSIIRYMATNHFRRGSLVLSKIVPEVTEKR